jgi:hypothetical protein
MKCPDCNKELPLRYYWQKKYQCLSCSKYYSPDFLYGYKTATDKMQEENKKLKFMVDNGLGWDDLKDDITYP